MLVFLRFLSLLQAKPWQGIEANIYEALLQTNNKKNNQPNKKQSTKYINLASLKALPKTSNCFTQSEVLVDFSSLAEHRKHPQGGRQQAARRVGKRTRGNGTHRDERGQDRERGRKGPAPAAEGEELCPPAG